MDISAEVVIECPRDEVARFVMDWNNDPVWISGITEAKKVTDAPFGEGTQVQRVAKFLGKRIEYVNDVTEFDPKALLSIGAVKGPFPMTIRYEFQEMPDGTRARIQVQGNATGFFKLAGPLLAQAVKRSVRNDLKELKRLMELGASS